MSSKGVTEEDINKIIKLTLDGANRTEISEKVNKSKQTVWKYQKLYVEGIL